MSGQDDSGRMLGRGGRSIVQVWVRGSSPRALICSLLRLHLPLGCLVFLLDGFLGYLPTWVLCPVWDATWSTGNEKPGQRSKNRLLLPVLVKKKPSRLAVLEKTNRGIVL